MSHKQVVRNGHTESCFLRNNDSNVLSPIISCHRTKHREKTALCPLQPSAENLTSDKSSHRGVNQCQPGDSVCWQPPHTAQEHQGGFQGLSGPWAGDIFGYHYPCQEPVEVEGFMSHSPGLFLLPASAGCGSWSLPSEPSITGAASECWKSVLNSPWNRGLGNWTRSSSAPLYPRDFWLLRYHMHLKKGEGGKNKSITSNRKCYFSLCFLCKSQPLT